LKKAEISTDLAKVDGQVDLVVLDASRQGRTLPPTGAAVDGVLGRMPLVWVVLVASVACLQKNKNIFTANALIPKNAAKIKKWRFPHLKIELFMTELKTPI
jgi:hypothetical protein